MPTPRPRHRRDGSIYWQVPFRHDGKQTSRSFDDELTARRFAGRIETIGVDAALHSLGVEQASRDEITLTEWLTLHVDSLTGVESGTLTRYRAYIVNDIAPVIGHLPLSAVTDTAIGRWVQALADSGASGKTIQNKHGFLSGALRAAVKARRITSNPCDDRRLPRTLQTERVFLTHAEFELLYSHIPRARWAPQDRYKNLTRWLVATGMRFSEAAALYPSDVDPVAGTCRITRSWKYTGNGETKIGPPKSRKSVRTINLPAQALEVYAAQGENGHEFLFTNGAGNAMRSMEFYHFGWKLGRDRAIAAGLTKKPRVHDLRHTCASWMLAEGVPLSVVQAHLGHEKITTTVDTYGHVDRSSYQAAADAISAAMSPGRT